MPACIVATAGGETASTRESSLPPSPPGVQCSVAPNLASGTVAERKLEHEVGAREDRAMSAHLLPGAIEAKAGKTEEEKILSASLPTLAEAASVAPASATEPPSAPEVLEAARSEIHAPAALAAQTPATLVQLPIVLEPGGQRGSEDGASMPPAIPMVAESTPESLAPSLQQFAAAFRASLESGDAAIADATLDVATNTRGIVFPPQQDTLPLLSPTSPATEPPSMSLRPAAFVPRTNRDGTYDGFIIYAPGTDSIGRENAVRATAIAWALRHRGLAVQLQGCRTVGTVASVSGTRTPLGDGKVASKAVGKAASAGGDVTGRGACPDEVDIMIQSAKRARCAVVLLTRGLIERVEDGGFGDTCAAAFTLAKRARTVIVATLEPELAHQYNWGWNRVSARLMGRPTTDLSMDTEDGLAWTSALDRLARLVTPDVQLVRIPEQESRASELVSPREVLTVEPEAMEMSMASKSQFLMHDMRYDCYLSHTWGKDRLGRSTHARVRHLAQQLRNRGLEVFFDEWETHRYRTTEEALVAGMRHSAAVVFCLTKEFIRKIEGAVIADDCVSEFTLAQRAACVISTVMEPEIANPTMWGWNKVYAYLADNCHLNMSANTGTSLSMLYSEDAQRWCAALDAVELKIRGSYLTHLTSGEDAAACFVPQREAMQFASCCFAIGAVLIFASAVLRLGSGGPSLFDVLALLGYSLLALGFIVSAVRIAQRARHPPLFHLCRAMLTLHLLFFNFLGVLGAFSVAAKACLPAFGVASPILEWLDLIGGLCLLSCGFATSVDSLRQAPPALARPKGAKAPRRLGFVLSAACADFALCVAAGLIAGGFFFAEDMLLAAAWVAAGFVLFLGHLQRVVWLASTAKRPNGGLNAAAAAAPAAAVAWADEETPH